MTSGARPSLLAQRRCDLPGTARRPGEHIASSRDEATAPALEIGDRSEAVILQIEQPVGVVERLLARSRDYGLHPLKRHPVICRCEVFEDVGWKLKIDRPFRAFQSLCPRIGSPHRFPAEADLLGQRLSPSRQKTAVFKPILAS